MRDLKATAAALHVDEPTVALLVETAAAAGLLATAADADGNPVWLPTDLVDAWALRPPAERWAGLVRAWLDSPRMPGLVGSRDTAGKTVERAGARARRRATWSRPARMTLAALADAAARARCLAAGTGVPSLVALLRWQRPAPARGAAPTRWSGRSTEAAALGVTGLGGLASYARDAAGRRRRQGARRRWPALLPEPVDHVLLQADLTAVAPGPLESQLARRLQLVADVESRGGATVYRFTPGSVRRALDTGWTAVELHEFLGSVSRTPVPQPLTYLVDDTARTFGIGAGRPRRGVPARRRRDRARPSCCTTRRRRTLGLRRLAPTVLVSTTAARRPAAPAARARRRARRRGGGRHRARRPPRPAPGADAPRAPRRAGPASARRTATRLRRSSPRSAPATGPRRPAPGEPAAALSASGSLAALREAVESGTPVLIGYVDNHGTRSERIVDPVSVEGGVLTAHDHRSDDVRTFAVHRITAVKTAFRAERP